MVRRMLMVVGVALLLAGCARGGERAEVRVETDADPVLDAPALAAAAERTVEVGTGRVRVRLTSELTGTDPTGTVPPRWFSFTVSGEGAFDTDRQLSMLTMRSAVPALQSLAGEGPLAELRERFGDGETSVIQSGRIVYLRLPLMGMVDPSLDGRWIRIDGSKIDALEPGGPGSATGGVITDPAALLGYLRGIGADLTTVGTEVIDGVETTHVRAVVSVRDALDAAGADRDRMEQALRGLGGRLGEAIEALSMPFDVYVDADGYVRRLAITYDLPFPDLLASLEEPSSSQSPAPGSARTITTTLTIDYFDLGEPVEISDPGPGEYVDGCELIENLLGDRQLPAGVPSIC